MELSTCHNLHCHMNHLSRNRKLKTPDPFIVNRIGPFYVTQGNDYVSINSLTTADATSTNLEPPTKLDHLYAAALAKVLIPHALTCFEHLFDLNSASTCTISMTASSAKRKISTFRINLCRREAQSVLSYDSYLILSCCWQILESAKLLQITSVKPQPIALFCSDLDNTKTYRVERCLSVINFNFC